MDKPEIQVAVTIDYSRALIVPLSKLSNVLELFMEHSYQSEGYGDGRTYKRTAASDLPRIELVTPAQLLTARLTPTEG